MNWRPRVYS